VHFWALIFIYMWAGPHHLHYTALPDWAQSLGMVFSLILLAPSWGGMINGIMTLSGAWHKLRTDPILKFLIVSLSFYGMSTFEGPMMSIKTVNALSHYTDWTIGHVHSGALGWVAMITIGSMYYLIPRLFGREMYSVKLIEVHFWIATIGIVLYIAAMWIAGVMQGLMWRAGQRRRHADLQLHRVVKATYPYYASACSAACCSGRHADHGLQRLEDGAPGRVRSSRDPDRRPPARRGEEHAKHESIEKKRRPDRADHLVVDQLRRPVVRSCRCSSRSSTTEPVERARALHRRCSWPGRDIYVREGCYNCHSQMIRPFRAETERYGHYSRGRRVRLRPPVPVGLQAHRPGPGARRRPLQRRVASRAPDQPARRGAGVEHAGLPVAGATPARRRASRRRCARCARWAPYTDEQIERPEGRRGQDRDGRADRLPAGTNAPRTEPDGWSLIAASPDLRLHRHRHLGLQQAATRRISRSGRQLPFEGRDTSAKREQGDKQ
jgi:hypothetical protein